MSTCRIRFLLATCIVLAATSIVAAGPVAGIVRTDAQPLETGPFVSYSTATGPEITHQFQSMYLTSQPNVWTKTFQWEIAPNTGLVPGNTLSITESIPLIYPNNSAGTDPLLELPISDWHESIASGDLSDFFQWDSQSPTTSISASIDGEEIPIHAHLNFSSNGNSIWFDFDPIQIPTQEGTSGTPVILHIQKQLLWTGPVLDPLTTSHHIDILVNEYPTRPALVGDYNNDGIVDAADYVVWRQGLGVTYMPNDYEVWRPHFGQTAGSSSGASANAAVPEPATLVLMIFAAGSWCLRRRRTAEKVPITRHC